MCEREPDISHIYVQEALEEKNASPTLVLLPAWFCSLGKREQRSVPFLGRGFLAWGVGAGGKGPRKGRVASHCLFCSLHVLGIAKCRWNYQGRHRSGRNIRYFSKPLLQSFGTKQTSGTKTSSVWSR